MTRPVTASCLTCVPRLKIKQLAQALGGKCLLFTSFEICIILHLNLLTKIKWRFLLDRIILSVFQRNLKDLFMKLFINLPVLEIQLYWGCNLKNSYYIASSHTTRIIILYIFTSSSLASSLHALFYFENVFQIFLPFLDITK